MNSLDKRQYFRELEDTANKRRHTYIAPHITDILFYEDDSCLIKICGLWTKTEFNEGPYISVPFPKSYRGYLHINLPEYYDWLDDKAKSYVPF